MSGNLTFSVVNQDLKSQKADCWIVPVFTNKTLTDPTKSIDTLAKGAIKKLIASKDLTGEIGQTLLLHNVTNLPTPKLLLVGCGRSQDFSATAYLDTMAAVAKQLQSLAIKHVHYFLCCPLKEKDLNWQLCHGSAKFMHSLYKFDTFKTKKAKTTLRNISFVVNSKISSQMKRALQHGTSIAKAMAFSCDLANTPANICTPAFLANEAKKLAKTSKKFSLAVLDKKNMQALKMNTLLAVAAGSNNPPKFITLEYRGNNSPTAKPIVFVGKGITFDTGGNSLKTPVSMIGMKYDMTGGATVLGILKFAELAKLPLNIIGVIAAAENMPGGSAARPDDIVTSMAGITVEILNTDAEGRLVLADALHYVKRYKPKYVVDIATLTGACVVALGKHHSGLFSNKQELADKIFKAGQDSFDKCWQLPITKEYHKQLESNAADIANVGGPEAGSITAACFLAKFSEAYAWAHLDIAGSGCDFTGKERGATGRPIPMLTTFLLDCAYG